MFRTVRCLGLVLVLVLVLGAPAVSAAGSREPEELSLRGGVLSALWDALVDLFPLTGETGGSSGTTSGGGGGTEGGPGMDPNGKPPGGP